MRITQQRTYNLSAEQLMEKLTSQSFYEERFAVLGVSDYEFAEFGESHEGFVVHIVRTLQVDMSRIPSFAKRFVNASMELSTKFVWRIKEGASFAGQYAVKMGNVPVTIEGNTYVQNISESQCQQEVRITVSSSVPLVGKKIAAALAERVEEVIEKDYQATLKVLEKEH